ncbi:unnamed protein product [Cyprideis torosa]|uniref:Uncharacterized protein n=1 Tax=Cyprideis torosa TaxID=163714 RepID=A0A7R8WY58_9CRUS|nr:unnamed protein product [Cyprideis torosa]CAG0909476.1 unnamed protein product [Cyprideis torosa]
MAPPSTPMPTDRLHGQWKLHVSENFEAFVDSINPDYDFSVPGCSSNMDDSRIELIISEKANGEWVIVIQLN